MNKIKKQVTQKPKKQNKSDLLKNPIIEKREEKQKSRKNSWFCLDFLKKIIKEHKWAALIISGLILMLASFGIDQIVIKNITLLKNPVFDYFFGWATSGLTLIIVFLVMTSLFMWKEKKCNWIIPLWASLTIAVVLSILIKMLVERERPFGIEMHLLLLKDYSFPSSHASACFAVIPILDRRYPMFKWFWVGFAVIIAFSRLYFQVHFLSDIIAGALLGYGVGIFVEYIMEKKIGGHSC